MQAPGGVPGQGHQGGHQPHQADDGDDAGSQTCAHQLGEPAGFGTEFQRQQAAAVVQACHQIGGGPLHPSDAGFEEFAEHVSGGKRP